MSFTERQLPDVTTVQGTFRFYLYYDSVLDSPSQLVVPAVNRIQTLGEVEERIDPKPGMVEIGAMQMTLVEDFSEYPEGFWKRVFFANEPARMKILLDEGSGFKYFFYGVVDNDATTFDEHFVSGTQYVRTCSVRWNNFLSILKGVSIADVVTEILLHPTTYKTTSNPGTPGFSNGEGNFIAMTSVLACVLKVAFPESNGAFSPDDVSVNHDDLQWSIDASDPNLWKGYEELYLCINIVSGSFPSGTNEYLDTASEYFWGDRYGTAFDLLIDLCQNNVFFPRIYYDIQDGRQKLELLARGRSSSPAISFSHEPKRSSFSGANLQVKAVRAHHQTSGNVGFDYVGWIIKGVYQGPGAGPGPLMQEWDMQVVYNFGHNTVSERLRYWIKTGETDGGIEIIATANDSRHWDSIENNWGTDSQEEQFTILSYFYKKFIAEKISVRRTFGGFRANDGSTSSQANITIGRRMSINLGDGAMNYYVTAFSKKQTEDEVSITAIQE
ncbi:MAG TPA: hypothetical protein VII11_00370 [Bacteroidota bacterium]